MQTRSRMLAGRGELTGTVSAALLSIVTRGLLRQAT